MEGDTTNTAKRKKGVKSVVYRSESIKKARIKGEEYVNYKGIIVPKRQTGESCK